MIASCGFGTLAGVAVLSAFIGAIVVIWLIFLLHSGQDDV